MAKSIPVTAAQKTNDGLAKIGNSFANLFRRQHAQALHLEAMQAEIMDLRGIVADLMTQLESAADEDVADE